MHGNLDYDHFHYHIETTLQGTGRLIFAGQMEVLAPAIKNHLFQSITHCTFIEVGPVVLFDESFLRWQWQRAPKLRKIHHVL